jgi:peptide/nickel transport system ATP-binding protein
MTTDQASSASSALEASGPALIVSNMDVTYRVRGQDRLALRNVSFSIGRGESFGLVGESGSGKSTAALALVRYLPSNGRVSAGTISINGLNPLSMGQRDLRQLRATTISMVYQEPGRALNPSMRVGRQIAEVFEVAGASSESAMSSAEDMLRKVQISDPGRVMRRYPHELSGGMAQRAVIAMALASSPSLLILDEPTTALDATVEAEVLDLVAALRQEFDTTVLFISHNLAVIAKMCDRVGVLYAGELVEEGPARQVFDDPRHPYTVGLLRCIPRRGQRKDRDRLDTIPGFLPTPGHSLTGCVFAPTCRPRAASTTIRRPTCPGPPRLRRRRWRPTGSAACWSMWRSCRRPSPAASRHWPGWTWWCTAARRSAWSASRAAARPRWPGSCSG